MQYVSVDNVVAFTKTLIKDKSTASMNIWGEWVYEAIRGLGYSDSEMKVCALYPNGNLSASLPKDCQQIIEVALYDASGSYLRSQFRAGKQRIYPDTRLFPTAIAGQPDNTTTVNLSQPVDVSNDQYSIWLGTNGSLVSTILIRYYSLPIDETGQLQINLDDRLCAAYFILYMEALREGDNQSKIQLAEQRFYKEADRCRARKKMESMTPAKMKTLMGDLMNMLPLNNMNKF